jgi:hypothetical protein
MSEDSPNDKITVRVLRNGEPEPPDDDWAMATIEERIEGVWTLTKLCMGLNKSSDVPRFERSITRVIRGKR